MTTTVAAQQPDQVPGVLVPMTRHLREARFVFRAALGAYAILVP
jgi:hypothetical protein